MSGALPLRAVESAVSRFGTGHKIQVKTSAEAEQALAQGGRLIGDYGSYKLLEVPSSVTMESQSVEDRDEYNRIFLNSATLDTSRPEIQAMRQRVGDFSGKRLHLVQFAGPVQPEWRQKLIGIGVQIVTYLPENTYLVYGDASSLAQVQALSSAAMPVQWDGQYIDSYKMHPDARLTDANGSPREIGTDTFAIQMVADASANGATLQVVDQNKLAPILRKRSLLSYLNVVVRFPAEKLDAIAARPDVISIQPYFPRKKFCERQDQIIAGNLTGNLPSSPGYLAWLATKGFTQAQFSASGLVVDVTDSGLDNGTSQPNHFGLYTEGKTTSASRVVYNRLEGDANYGSTIKGCDGHGNLNAHVIGGYNDLAVGFPHTDSAGYHYGLGVCPFVRLGSSVIFDPNYFTYPDYTDLQSRAYHDGARISSNSWGADNSGYYDSEAQEYDSLVRDAQPSGAAYSADGNQEMVIVFANGNAGPYARSVGTPATAKNVISVGAGENVQAFGGADGCDEADSGANSANDMASFSSRGPCADSRRKPDITAPGTHVSGGVAQASNPGALGTADSCYDGTGVCGGVNSVFYPNGQEFYTASSGTSHSAPGVSGGCALVRQYFINHFGVVPSPAMTKAYLMNSARYMTGTGSSDALWSNTQGMGEMNLGIAFDDSDRGWRDEKSADLFTASGQTRVFGGTISDPSKPFRVTLAWTDAPGNTAGNAYNNNLDLVVVVGGATYKGNVFSRSNSVTGGSADSRNNVESVFLPAGLSGTYTITVTAVSINSDGVPNNDTPLDQDFALVVYNGLIGEPPVISQQPASVAALQGRSVTFSVGATGSSPLSYQWRQDGLEISGATTSSYTIASAAPANAGVYTVVIANTLGSVVSSDATLTVIPTVPLAYALNNSNLTWSVDADNPWYGQTTYAQDGVAAAQSYFIGDSQQSSLRTSISGPCTLTFFWRVSSQTNGDVLSFLDNGVTQSSISGEVDWQQQSAFISAGTHTLTWVYSKDSSSASGLDAGFVDQVVSFTGTIAPFISVQPASQDVFAGSSVVFTVGAAGTPPLSYQWQRDGVDLAGATMNSLKLAAAQVDDGGTYSARVSNAQGSVVSSGAVLGVIPAVASGDNSFGQSQISSASIGAVAIASGFYHNLALRPDGSVVAWGNLWNGQCTVPSSLGRAMAIAAGGYHSLALRTNGTVVGWGANDYGQTTPPTGLSGVTTIAAGAWHSLALRANGTVVAWGDNSFGQASPPTGLNNVAAIAAGGDHCLVLRSNGTVVGWGRKDNAAGVYVGQSVVPPGLSNVVAIAAGDYHSLAVKKDGTVVAWGDDSSGQCRPPSGLTNAIAVAGGGAHSVALRGDRTAVAWGNNDNGQCDLPSGLTNVVEVAAGEAHTVVLLGSSTSTFRITSLTRVGSQFSVQVQTQVGKRYALEYRASLASGSWTELTSIQGDGTVRSLVDPSAPARERFYRVRQY